MIVINDITRLVFFIGSMKYDKQFTYKKYHWLLPTYESFWRNLTSLYFTTPSGIKQEIKINRMLPQKLNTNSLGAKGWSKKKLNTNHKKLIGYNTKEVTYKRAW